MQFEDHYQCKLSDDLVQWFDEGVFAVDGGNEYRDVIDPSLLLCDVPEVIWPCLMPPDFLPLIGSGQGDWLGVRVDADNNASEIIQWYHGGGDWIPWGRTLAEAILFDAVCDQLPGPHRRHAIPAEPIKRRPANENDWANWALKHLPPEVKSVLSPDCSSTQLAERLIENEVAEIAVRCELVQDCLHEPLSETLTLKKAVDLGLDWDSAVEWMFDVDRIPDSLRQSLQSNLGLSLDVAQDWNAAAEHCRRVIEASAEHAWAFDLLGYSLEKLGETDQAIDVYLQGASASVFTAQSVRLKTHWAAQRSAKFSTSRLLEIDADGVRENSYLSLLIDGDAQSRRESVKELHLADVPTKDSASAYQKLVAAGWDLGAEPITAYADILQQIVHAAEAADQKARARVAATHLSCFASRYSR